MERGVYAIGALLILIGVLVVALLLRALKRSLEKTRTETITRSELLKDQIARIGSEAANVSRALKGDIKVLGNWGENMLDLILEKSGLQRGLHYRRQEGMKDEEGKQRI